jgi:hypothetical protein
VRRHQNVWKSSAATAAGGAGGRVSRSLRRVERYGGWSVCRHRCAEAHHGKQIKNRSVTGADIKRNSLSSAAIKDGSLLGRDFKLGELAAGAAGPKGDYDKAASDARFLGATGKAADADKLDGLDSTQIIHGNGQGVAAAMAFPRALGGQFLALSEPEQGGRFGPRFPQSAYGTCRRLTLPKIQDPTASHDVGA